MEAYYLFMSIDMIGPQKVQLPVLVEKDEDGFFVVECPLLQGCFTQGKTLDEALKNIHEVIELCLEEQKEALVEQRIKTWFVEAFN